MPAGLRKLDLLREVNFFACISVIRGRKSDDAAFFLFLCIQYFWIDQRRVDIVSDAGGCGLSAVPDSVCGQIPARFQHSVPRRRTRARSLDHQRRSAED